MLKDVLSMSERLACNAVGLARSTYRNLPQAQAPADPDAEMRAWLRSYATKNPCHGFRRAWARLRYDERREVNKKKIHRLWREEGLQVKVTSPRKRAGVSSIPPIAADAPNVVWAIDFQFDSTIDGKAVKIASMIDEHTRESMLHLVERSITAQRLVMELEDRYGISIPEDEARELATVGSVVDYLATKLPSSDACGRLMAVAKLKKLLGDLDEPAATIVFTHSSWVEQRHD